MDHLNGKTAVITGASRGIGAATARLFAENGARVLLVSRSAASIADIAAEITANGGKAEAIAADVADYAAMRAVMARADTFGGVDILVNNAGAIDPISRLDESDPAEWARVANVNFKGVFNGIHAALSQMLPKGAGTIINISSGAAVNALEGWSHYCASKAGALMLTRCTDKEYRDLGIRAIGLSPGTVATEMQVSIKKSGINPVSALDPNVHIPPEWVAQAIAYLCGPVGDAFRGVDFQLRSEESRKALGLPLGAP